MPSSADDLEARLTHEENAEELFEQQRYEEALRQADCALAIDPKSVAGWFVRANACKALGHYWDAAEAMEAILARVPGLADLHVNLGNIYAALERFDKAELHLKKAVELQPSLVEAHASLSSVYIRMTRFDLAEERARQVLALDPENATASTNLAAALVQKNAPAGPLYANWDLCLEQVIVERSERANAPTVLILAGAGPGNVPFQHLLPRANYNRIIWYLEHAPLGQADGLPPHDFVFNAVGDLDAASKPQHAAEQFAARCPKAIINRPDRIKHTSRSAMARRIAQIPDTLVPMVARFERADGDPIKAVLNSDLRFPFIVRPAGGHGGEGAVLVQTAAELAASFPDAEAVYVTQFVDYRSADGWYRKYRAIFVDGQPYPYHLAIGQNWLLHYWKAGMEADAARRDEELRFLNNPQEVLGPRVWGALHRIAAAMELDYAGIDFSLLDDGRLLFFEANATMLVQPEDDPVFAYKNSTVRRILGAFQDMAAARQALL